MGSFVFTFGAKVKDLIESPCMTWDYDKDAFQKQALADPVWGLERLILYGGPDVKLDKNLLETHLSQLNIPEDRRAFLELLVWNKPF